MDVYIILCEPRDRGLEWPLTYLDHRPLYHNLLHSAGECPLTVWAGEVICERT